MLKGVVDGFWSVAVPAASCGLAKIDAPPVKGRPKPGVLVAAVFANIEGPAGVALNEFANSGAPGFVVADVPVPRPVNGFAWKGFDVEADAKGLDEANGFEAFVCVDAVSFVVLSRKKSAFSSDACEGAGDPDSISVWRSATCPDRIASATGTPLRMAARERRNRLASTMPCEKT